MPAKNTAAHWAALPTIGGLLFSRGQFVICPSGRKAMVTQYWVLPTHEYSGCAAIRYCDNNGTAILRLTLLKVWQPGVTYTAPPLIRLKPIPAPIC